MQIVGDYRDPAGATRAAVVALSIYMVLDVLVAALYILVPPDPIESGIADAAALPLFLVMLACFFLVGRWIYVTNANAHRFDEAMSITPGWAVGWFFVPFANLIKPYEGVAQTWRASHDAAGLSEEAETSLLRWWWGLWLVTNILSNIAFQIGGDLDAVMSPAANGFQMVAALLNVPLCLILIQLMKRLARAQNEAFCRETFV
jgi:hypothetical protein